MDNSKKTAPRKTTPARQRADILADIAAIGHAVRGTITEKPRRLADGTVRVYYQLQHWEDGRNRTIHIPAHLVDAFKAAVAEGRRLDALLDELSDCGTRDMLANRVSYKTGDDDE